MKNKTLLIVILIIIAAVLVIYQVSTGTDTPSNSIGSSTGTQVSAIEGCYVATLSKDVYTLNIENESNGEVSGQLEFDNFEKDSSQGTFTGTYQNGVILADYAFSSEGMNSVRQVIFQKTGDGFMEGFGPVTVEGNYEKFTNVNEVSYDSGILFKKAACN